jgi:hypothetical protein
MPDDNKGTGTGASGYGQFQPSDGAHPYNINKFIVDQAIKQVVTAKIVRVMAVFNADGGAVSPSDTGQVGMTGKLSVQPLVGMQDGQGNTQPHGIINGIPFSRSQGGKNAVIMDPQVGDIGIMIVADRDSSAVKKNRDEGPPGSRRSHDIADGMYVCSLLNNNEPEQYVRFRDDGIELVDMHGNTVNTGPEGVLITDTTGSVIDMKGGGITCTPNGGVFKIVGDAEVTGDLKGNSEGTSVGLNTHTHTQPNDSHNDTEMPTNSPTPGT